MVICFANVLSCIDFVTTSSFERCIGHVIDKSISIIRSKTELIIPPPVNFINHCPRTAQYGFFPSDWNELMVVIEGSVFKQMHGRHVQRFNYHIRFLRYCMSMTYLFYCILLDSLRV